MVESPVGRLALMSVRPEFADAILAGTKTVEFRKRPLADDVSYVVLYSTLPVSAVVGLCQVGKQVTTTPTKLWSLYSGVAGISKRRLLDYYSGYPEGTAIDLTTVYTLLTPLSLSESVGIGRPPQSFQYLNDRQATQVWRLFASENDLAPI